MAIKKKTHLNLSGSHHTLDSDNAFVGGTAYITGALSASTNISAQGNLFVQGTTQLTGAVNLASTFSASSNISTQGNLFVQGTSQFTGSVYANGLVSGSQGIFTQLTASLSGTAAGLPFLVSGGNMGGVNYNTSTGQWEITGSAGTSVTGSNTQVQFNADGVHGASSLLTFNTASVGSLTIGTLSVPSASLQFLSGANTSTFLSNFGPPTSALVINTDVVVTNSLMAFDGVDPTLQIGGLILQNGAGISMFSGSSVSGDPHFKINAAQQSGKVDVNTSAATFKINGFDFVPLWNHATTSNAAPSTNLSGSLLSDIMPAAGIGLFDLNVIAADTNQANYASWRTIVTMTSSNAGGIDVAGITELDNILVGSSAASWDLNIRNSNIEVTGSLTGAGFVYWFAKLTQKMILSSSGEVKY